MDSLPLSCKSTLNHLLCSSGVRPYKQFFPSQWSQNWALSVEGTKAKLWKEECFPSGSGANLFLLLLLLQECQFRNVQLYSASTTYPERVVWCTTWLWLSLWDSIYSRFPADLTVSRLLVLWLYLYAHLSAPQEMFFPSNCRPALAWTTQQTSLSSGLQPYFFHWDMNSRHGEFSPPVHLVPSLGTHPQL